MIVLPLALAILGGALFGRAAGLRLATRRPHR